MTEARWLIYGANGYTGELIAREAARRGWLPILGGRNRARIESLGRELGLSTRVFGLDDPGELAAALVDVHTVLHCAGPFVHTSAPMVQACLLTRTNYLDITGEIPVFEAIAGQAATAREAGVALIPGVGLDVVPSDCLAARLAEALPDAVDLQLAFVSTRGGLSRGTLKSGIEGLPSRGFIRRDGQLVPVALDYDVKEIEFGCGRRTAMAVRWGDVSTAYHTTGIPNIRVYLGLPARAIQMSRLLELLMPIAGWAPVKRLARWWVDRTVVGPDPETRARGKVYFWGKATNSAGRSVEGRLTTPEGYSLTVSTALASLERVLSGGLRQAQAVPPGFWTPARAFGAHFIDPLPGVEVRGH